MAELVWCVETLEAYETVTSNNPPYELNSQSEYPAGSTAFKSINILTGGALPGSGTWQKIDYVTGFGENTVIAANSPVNGEIDIYYSTGAGA